MGSSRIPANLCMTVREFSNVWGVFQLSQILTKHPEECRPPALHVP